MRAGLCSLKPSVGKLPNAGALGFSTHYDTPGPMARNVADLAALMDVLTKSRRALYTAALTSPAASRVRMGRPREYAIASGVEDTNNPPKLAIEAVALYDSFLSRLRWECPVISTDMPDSSPLSARDRPGNDVSPRVKLLYTQTYNDVNKFLSKYISGVPIKTLSDLKAWYDKEAVRMHMSSTCRADVRTRVQSNAPSISA